MITDTYIIIDIPTIHFIYKYPTNKLNSKFLKFLGEDSLIYIIDRESKIEISDPKMCVNFDDYTELRQLKDKRNKMAVICFYTQKRNGFNLHEDLELMSRSHLTITEIQEFILQSGNKVIYIDFGMNRSCL